MCAQPRVERTRLRLWESARFLQKIGYNQIVESCKVGEQLTQPIRRITVHNKSEKCEKFYNPYQIEKITPQLTLSWYDTMP